VSKASSKLVISVKEHDEEVEEDGDAEISEAIENGKHVSPETENMLISNKSSKIISPVRRNPETI
jgi:hypothetical protein